jgi:hypothetical protein
MYQLNRQGRQMTNTQTARAKNGAVCADVLHEPRLDTVLMVEKAVWEAEEYPTRMQLWRKLPRRVQYQTFKRIINYLEASGKIAFDGSKIIYTGVNNPKLEALMRSSVKVR